jgi:hypothetical protein
MPVRRRNDKRREALTDDALAWLSGKPSFYAFKDHDDLLALWRAHGDENVATWDLRSDTSPVAVDLLG